MVGELVLRRWLVLILLLVAPATAWSACGGDGGGMTDPDPGRLSIRVASGDNQTEATGDSVPDPLVVEVTRDGSAVEGEAVSWAVVDSAGPGAALTSTRSTTGADGHASTRMVLGSAAGSYRVQAALVSGEDSTFLTAAAEVPEARTVRTDGGDGQSGNVDETLPDSLVARVIDQFGDPLAETQVSFEITRGRSAGASVDPSQPRTDSTGRASAALTLGSKNGTYRAVAVAGPDTASFSADATGGTEFLLAVDSVRPTPLQAGGTATVFGAGFSTTPGDNSVLVDGTAASVTSATDSRLEIDVPTFTDKCLPRREVDVEVALAPDTASPVTTELVPSVSPLSLAAGEDTVLAGPDAVDCVLLPGSSAGGAEYEVMATTVPDVSGAVQTVELHVNGNGSVGSDEQRPVARIDGRRVRGGGIGVPDWRHEQYEWDRRLRRMERAWIDDIRRRARRAPSMSRTVGSISPAVASPGDSASFAVSCVGDSVRAVAKTVSDAAVIYEDTLMASEGAGLTDAQYDSIAARFDTLTFAVDTTYFGPPADIDGNGRVIMLFTPAVNRLDGDYSDGFIVGFFCGLDLSTSNEAEMFYLVSPDPSGDFTPAEDGSLSKSFIRSIIEGTVIHEFQHLINAQIGGGSDPTTTSGGGAQETWLNEGLSHLAEEMGGHAAAGLGPGQQLGAADLTADPDVLNQFYSANFRNLSEYLSAPHTGTGPVSPDANFRTRGAAWSFVRYLLDRFAQPGSEEDLARALIQSPVSDAPGAVEDAIQTVTGRSVDFEDLVAEWGSMFAVEDRSDLGGTPRPALEFESYRLRDVYSDPNFGSGGSYPLAPSSSLTEVSLAAKTMVSASLSASSGRYLRLLSSTESVGTGLQMTSSEGGDLSPNAEPRLVVIRTK